MAPVMGPWWNPIWDAVAAGGLRRISIGSAAACGATLPSSRASRPRRRHYQLPDLHVGSSVVGDLLRVLEHQPGIKLVIGEAGTGWVPYILLGKDPERQREIDSICGLVERLAAAGIPAAKYNLCIIGIPRTEREPGRSGSRNAAFRWSHADQAAPPTSAGIVSEQENWERIDHSLGAVVPVAAKVRLACHLHDPYTPPGYRGVTRVLGTVEGMKRFVEMHESPYHGLNFCQGTIAEMLDDPAREIFAVIRWFGKRGKIFNVHFRNIKGHKLDFMEAFPDEGDIDMARALAAYRDVGYPYMLMPDHVPQIDGRDPSGVAFAYCYGYIQALLDALVPQRGDGRA
jgi:mannonate dehydratase